MTIWPDDEVSIDVVETGCMLLHWNDLYDHDHLVLPSKVAHW